METSNSRKIWSFLLLGVLVLLLAAGIYLEVTRGGLVPGGNTPGNSNSGLADLSQPSPDGQYTAFVTAADAGMNGSAIQLSRKGAKDVQVVAKGDDGSWVTNPIWSPDGKRIAFLRIKNIRASEFEIDPQFELWVYTVESGEEKLLTDASTLNPSISFDGVADIKWLSDNEIQYPDNTAFPIQYYTVNIDTLQTKNVVSKGGIEPHTAVVAAQPGAVPYFSQCDSRWGSKVLGTCSGLTICSQGCAISSTAMVFKYFGISTDPNLMNEWLKENSGYVSGCLINWATAANMSPSDLTYVARVPSQDWSRLRYELDNGYPVILEVKINGGQHFVVATGYMEDTYYINDPYYPSRTTLTSYGNVFYGLRIYHGKTSEPATCPANTDTKTFVCTPTLTPAYNDNSCQSLWYPIRGFSGNASYLVENAATEATSTNSGKWVPNLPSAGKYRVEAFIAAHGTFSKTCSYGTQTYGADSSKAKYVITSKDGTQTEVIRDQLPLNDEWLNLGEYYFDAGTSGKVTLSDLTGETESARNVSFGAMRFTLVGPEEYPVPVVSQLSPSIKPVGAKDFKLTIIGSGFYPESIVRWNDSDRPTTYISESQLTAIIPAADIAAAGTALVTVSNPQPGGGLSNAANFSIINISPQKAELLTTSKVTFDWDDIPGAELYQVQLATTSDFSNVVMNVKTTESTYAYDAYLEFSSVYYWRIRVKSGGTWSIWSPRWKFTAMDPLTPPVLVAPDYKVSLTDATVSMAWGSVVNAVQYKVQVALDPAFVIKVAGAKTGFLTMDYTLATGKYYWRVRAIDASGGKGPWSEVRIFKVVAP